ncbi:MAG: DUF5723 family protein [Prevotellaceae bacterium]|jgi:hypothetical protein|nr:DUF5723 family protein [Prevotellaceae bacterium]
MKRIAIILTLCSIIGTGKNIFGQQATVMYFMKDNPLQHNFNPAFQPERNFYFGFPVLSSLNISAGNNSLIFADVFYGRTIDGKKQTVSFLHPEVKGGVDNFLNSLRKNTRFYAEFSATLLSFGLRHNKSYYTFDVSTRAEGQFMLPESVPALFFRGVEDKEGETEFNLRSLSFSATAYTQIALGSSYNYDKQWNFGAKLKILLGHANLDGYCGDMSLKVSKERWLLQGESSLYGTVPGLEFKKKDDYTFDGMSFDGGNKSLFSGVGLAGDLGATFNFFESLRFSASVVDIGFIHWNKNIHKTNKENDFEFEGITYDINNDSIDYWEEYRNMLEGMYVVERDPKSYSTMLTAKIYAGAEYSILKDRLGFGLLSKTYIAKKEWFQDFIVSVNYRPFRPLAVSANYSLLNGKWSNIGFGMNVNAGPVNLFVCADNIPLKFAKGGGMMIPTNTKMTSVSFGINFMFGREKTDAE